MSPGVTCLLMRRYGWTAAEAQSVPVCLLPLLIGEA